VTASYGQDRSDPPQTILFPEHRHRRQLRNAGLVVDGVIDNPVQQHVHRQHEPIAKAIAKLTQQPPQKLGITDRVVRIGDPAAAADQPVQVPQVKGIRTTGRMGPFTCAIADTDMEVSFPGNRRGIRWELPAEAAAGIRERGPAKGAEDS
jgi:hypothetical protein